MEHYRQLGCDFAWMEFMIESVAQGSGMPPLRLFRLLRVLRSLRVVRALRLFRELRLVLLSLFHAVRPLLWCCFTLTMILFVFSIFFMQMLGGSLLELTPEQLADVDVTWPTDLVPFMGTCLDTMIFLFANVAGGTDWHENYVVLQNMTPMAGVVFMVFILSVILGVLNVIAAVFVEGAISKAKGDHDLSLAEEQDSQKEVANELIKVFRAIDTEGTSHITLEAWMAFTRTDAGKDFLTLFNIEKNRAKSLFEILDLDDSNGIQVEEFVVGFMQLHGSVNKLKQYELEVSLKNQKAMIRKCLCQMENFKVIIEEDVLASLDDLSRRLAAVQSGWKDNVTL